MMIAQITSDMVHGLPYIVVTLGAVLWVWNQAKEAWGGLQGTPGEPPNAELEKTIGQVERRTAKLEDGMVGPEWFAKVDCDLADIKRDLKTDRDDNEKHISARASKIYSDLKDSNESLHKQIQAEGERRVIQIDDVRRELSENLEAVRKELSENQRDLPNQIVTLLKNTGAI